MPLLNLDDKEHVIKQGNILTRGLIMEAPVIFSMEQNNKLIVRADIDVDEDQPIEVINDLLDLLNQYRDCIATNLQKLGCAKDVEFINIYLKIVKL